MPALIAAAWFGGLWALGLPLPYADFQFFHEPAIRLATEGRAASFGLSCFDPALADRFDVYVPGYILFWAALYKAFGVGLATFQLGSAAIHVAGIAALWLCAARLPVRGPAPGRDAQRGAAWGAWLAAGIFFCMAINPHPQSLGILLGLSSLAVLFGPPSAARRIAAGALAALCLFTSPLAAFAFVGFGAAATWSAGRRGDAALYLGLAAAMAFALFGLWATVAPDALASVVRHIGRQLVFVHQIRPEAAGTADQLYAALRNLDQHFGRLHRYLRLAPALALLAAAAWLWRPLRRPAAIYAALLVAVSLVSALDYLQAQVTSALLVMLLMHALLRVPARRAAATAAVALVTVGVAYEAVKSLAAGLVHPAAANYAAAARTLGAHPIPDGAAAAGVYLYLARAGGARTYNYEFCAWTIERGLIRPPAIVVTPLFYELDRGWLERDYRRVEPADYALRGLDRSSPWVRTHFPYDARPVILERRSDR
ncbi:MAG: hypothetical protein AB7K86_14750 [Rhodospirillales bacterium]